MTSATREGGGAGLKADGGGGVQNYEKLADVISFKYSHYILYHLWRDFLHPLAHIPGEIVAVY